MSEYTKKSMLTVGNVMKGLAGYGILFFILPFVYERYYFIGYSDSISISMLDCLLGMEIYGWKEKPMIGMIFFLLFPIAILVLLIKKLLSTKTNMIAVLVCVGINLIALLSFADHMDDYDLDMTVWFGLELVALFALAILAVIVMLGKLQLDGGFAIGSVAGASVAQAQRYCDECGKPIAIGAAFCGSCGKPVVTKIECCTKCGAPLIEGAVFCGECGTPVAHAQTTSQVVTEQVVGQNAQVNNEQSVNVAQQASCDAPIAQQEQAETVAEGFVAPTPEQ